MTTTANREAKLRSLTNLVQYFDPSDTVHLAHFTALAATWGELAAAMLVSQDAANNANDELELTDGGQINTHPGWRKLNRVVRHGETSRYMIFDAKADTKAGGRLVPIFTRDQTVPSYMQPE